MAFYYKWFLRLLKFCSHMSETSSDLDVGHMKPLLIWMKNNNSIISSWQVISYVNTWIESFVQRLISFESWKSLSVFWNWTVCRFVLEKQKMDQWLHVNLSRYLVVRPHYFKRVIKVGYCWFLKQLLNYWWPTIRWCGFEVHGCLGFKFMISIRIIWSIGAFKSPALKFETKTDETEFLA